MAFTIVYQIDDSPVPAFGYILPDSDVDEISTAVRAILQDDTGVTEAWEALQDLPTTSFAESKLQSILAAPDAFDEWRVGEALAEHHLTDSKGCTFPWPDSRSTRNPNSSGGGVDLVGFNVADRVRFVFAEVKTSHQQGWPPGVVTSRSHGLQAQLSGLNAGDDRGRWAIRYLGMNGIDRPWFDTFRSATKTYLANQNDVMIFGVLVHVAEPDVRDLRALASGLSESLSAETTIELAGLYIGAESLKRVAGAPILVETVA